MMSEAVKKVRRGHVLEITLDVPKVNAISMATSRALGEAFCELRDDSDLRVGIGSSFMLNATANPDFGQVDADPAVINLTAFESFFQERRPFFVDDA